MMANSSIFPSKKNEVLAMLYVQSQDLSQKSPVEIAEMYEQAFHRIEQYYGDTISEKMQNKTWSL